MAEHSGSGQWGRIGTNVLAWLVVFLTGSVGVVCAREPLPPLEFGEPVPDAATPAELAPSSPSRDEPLDSLQNNPGHWLNKLAQSMTRSEPDKNSRSDLSVLSCISGCRGSAGQEHRPHLEPGTPGGTGGHCRFCRPDRHESQ